METVTISTVSVRASKREWDCFVQEAEIEDSMGTAAMAQCKRNSLGSERRTDHPGTMKTSPLATSSCFTPLDLKTSCDL